VRIQRSSETIFSPSRLLFASSTIALSSIERVVFPRSRGNFRQSAGLSGVARIINDSKVSIASSRPNAEE